MYKVDDVCTLQKSEGVGKLQLVRYYFDTAKKKCLPFLYKGISGNDNNFDTIEECTAVCTEAEIQVYQEPM